MSTSPTRLIASARTRMPGDSMLSSIVTRNFIILTPSKLPQRHPSRSAITPVSPSTRIICPGLILLVAIPRPSTAGMPYSRATIAPWARILPRSVTRPEKRGLARKFGKLSFFFSLNRFDFLFRWFLKMARQPRLY